MLGRFAESKPLLREALQIAIELDDVNTLGLTLQSMSMIAFAEQEMDEAEQLIEKALVNFREHSDTWHLTNALNLLGWIYVSKEQFTAAQRNFSEAIIIATRAHLGSNALDAAIGLASAQAKLSPLPFHLTVARHVLLTQQVRKRRGIAPQNWIYTSQPYSPPIRSRQRIP